MKKRLKQSIASILGLWIAFGGGILLRGGEEGIWPQFRGPNATGIAAGKEKLPERLDPEKNALWKTPLPPGHSSPAVHGDRIYITAARGRDLLTIALDARSGKALWEEKAPHGDLEVIHQIGSHAQPSPATDGRRVVSFFGSSGLLCYDAGGKLLWRKALGPFKNTYGAGSSPIISGNRAILSQDHDTDSFLAAYDLDTGKEVWKTDRSEFPRGYATPVLWESAGRRQIVISGTLRAVGYDFESGQEVWTVRGLARIVNMTPAAGADGNLYVGGWTAGADAGDRIQVDPFAAVLKARDGDRSGTIESREIPEGPLKSRFPQIDLDKDGHITEAEWIYSQKIFEKAENAILAIKPGGRGDITATHVLWRQDRFLPYVPSPVYYNGHIFMVKNGGIFTSLDARTGQPVKQGRVAGKSDYYASPVAGDGKIYLLSQRGELSVVSAAPRWEELSATRLEEDAYASPALAGGRIYVRTMARLYCFGGREGEP